MEELVKWGAYLAVGLIGWLLANKDSKQAHEIELLFQKHDKDAQDLADLRLLIAKEHYIKAELDERFKSLDSTFREGFRELNTQFSTLSAALLAHIAKEDSRPQ